MAKGKPRDRIVTIERIYESPKLLSEQDSYNYYSFGIKLADGSYANINVSAVDEQEAQEKAEKKFRLENGEIIQEGETYKVYEESTDDEHKYWNVVAFVEKEKGTPHVLSKQPDIELSKVEKEVENGIIKVGSKIGGGKPSYNEGARIGMIFNNAVNLCIAECKYTNLDIEKRFISLKKLLDELEGK